jgi:hypothetical protein
MKFNHRVFRKCMFAKAMFILAGIGSTLWFLVRVIPKPSRAGYPCMRAAAPVMSAFILYLISISSSVFVFRKFKRTLFSQKYLQAIGFLVITLSLIYLAGSGFNQDSKAMKLADVKTYAPNDPVGVPKGLFPGRVVWVWDNEATDESCTNTSGDWWFQNSDQETIDSMMIKGIMAYAGTEELSGAWDAIFRHFNSNHGKGDVGYAAGEKIYVKINITNSCCSVNGTAKYTDFNRMDATPEVLLALLEQLIDIVGIEESDIYLGDPFRTFHDLYWDYCHSVYPDVNYCDGIGINGRHQTIATSEHLMVFSDGLYDYRIPQEYVDAEYLINLPCLKTHDSGGITIAAKNHQGSVLQDGASSPDQSAFAMHYALPDHDDTDGGPHRYRHLVDYMGHEQLGGKTLLVIVDGIWAGRSWEGFVEKWNMSPFNNDYPSSLFFSQDLVAIESVCWDFLLKEYEDKPSGQQYPYMEGTEDYIRQAADPEYWADGITYDPEGDEIPLGSLGVYEHWNNGTDKEYTEIDFVKVMVDHSVNPDAIIEHDQDLDSHCFKIFLYPNPTSEHIFIEYALEQPSEVTAELFSIQGSLVLQIFKGHLFSGSQSLILNTNQFKPGSYLVRIQTKSEGNTISVTKQFQVI